MQINRNWFLKKGYIFENDLDLSNLELDKNHIRKIEDCHFIIKGDIYDSLFVMNIHITCKVTAVSSYSLKDVILNLNITDTINVSDEVEDDEELFYEKNDIFEIDPYIISLIIAEVPMVVTAEGEELPSDGKGYRILSEEEYLEEQKNKKDDRWSVLDDIEL